MAGVLYFFRLFVYHLEFGQRNESIHDLLSMMERRLYRYITVPAMVVAVLAGIFMVYFNPGLLSQGWFHLKLLFAILLIGVTLYGQVLLRRFHLKQFQIFSSRHLRILNEVPTLLMILIVFLVIMRP